MESISSSSPDLQLAAKWSVAVTLPFFVPAIFAISQTDLILTVPHKLAEITADVANVRILEAPREIQPFPYFMSWHPRLTNEPAHIWFREQLRSAVRTPEQFEADIVLS